MGNKNINAHCAICGKGYHVCMSCKEEVTFKPWRSVTDTVNCYKIYMAIHGYTVTKDAEQAKKELDTCDLSDVDSFLPEIQEVIKKIKGIGEVKSEPKVEVEPEKNSFEIVKEEIPVEKSNMDEVELENNPSKSFTRKKWGK